jgi:spore germination protein
LGVDVDFEYIYPNDRELYNSFLTELKAELQPRGLTLSTAIAPKISATQVGTLYEAHDYAFHGSVVDYLIIMTYEWGYLYGPPMAVAPYSEVKRVLSYAVTEIPSQKILMGMPNYAYDWTLPFTKGRPAEILSINEAIKRADNLGAEIQFNQTSQADREAFVLFIGAVWILGSITAFTMVVFTSLMWLLWLVIGVALYGVILVI